MRPRQLPLTKARTQLSRLARQDALLPGEVVEVTRRGQVALVVQRADDYARLRRRTDRTPRRLWGSLTLAGDLEEASRRVNARLRRSLRRTRGR